MTYQCAVCINDISIECPNQYLYGSMSIFFVDLLGTKPDKKDSFLSGFSHKDFFEIFSCKVILKWYAMDYEHVGEHVYAIFRWIWSILMKIACFSILWRWFSPWCHWDGMLRQVEKYCKYIVDYYNIKKFASSYL